VIVEGTPSDRAAARAGLATLQRDGRVAFGGFFEDGAALVVARASSLGEAVAWLTSAGGWEHAPLNARPWSQTL
jgi:hypothetical protein